MDCIKKKVKSDVLEEGTIEGVTKRHRMKVEKRKELLIICTHCGQQMHQSADLPFECEECHNRFSRQQDLTHHKQQKCAV